MNKPPAFTYDDMLKWIAGGAQLRILEERPIAWVFRDKLVSTPIPIRFARQLISEGWVEERGHQGHTDIYQQAGGFAEALKASRPEMAEQVFGSTLPDTTSGGRGAPTPRAANH